MTCQTTAGTATAGKRSRSTGSMPGHKLSPLSKSSPFTRGRALGIAGPRSGRGARPPSRIVLIASTSARLQSAMAHGRWPDNAKHELRAEDRPVFEQTKENGLDHALYQDPAGGGANRRPLTARARPLPRESRLHVACPDRLPARGPPSTTCLDSNGNVMVVAHVAGASSWGKLGAISNLPAVGMNVPHRSGRLESVFKGRRSDRAVCLERE